MSIGLPAVQGAGGERTQVSAEFGTGGSSSGASFEFFPNVPGAGGGFQLNAGDHAVPVYGPTIGNAQGLSSAGVLDYASAGGFNNSGQWRLIGYNVYRAGSGGAVGSVEANATYQNYDQRLTVQDVEAGASGNTITAANAVVDGGAGDDSITLEAGYFFAGPDWEGTFDLSGVVDDFSPSAAQARNRFRYAGLSGYPLLYPERANLLGGFALAGDGDDTVLGSAGQDVIGGGHGADTIDGAGGSDTVLVGATDSGVDRLADSGLDSYAYLDYYYWSRGILNWDERAAHGNEWRVDADGGDYAYFDTEEEALAWQSYGTPVSIAPLPEAAPVLTRDAPLYAELVVAGVLTQDVLAFGPGLSLEDLDISVQVDAFSAQDYPDRAWINGGQVSIRWGADSGVDFMLGRLDGGHEGLDLLSGGGQAGSGDEVAPDGTWFGYRLGEGFEAFRFADGATLTVDELLASATVSVNESQSYVFHRDSGYQLIDRRFATIEMTDGIAAWEVQVKRDDRDLLVSVPEGYPAPGAQGRIRNWYADPQATPQTSLAFELDPTLDAAALTERGLEVHGTFEADSLIGLNAFADRLFGEGGDDVLVGGGGDDTLAGGWGEDFLDGGAGKDTYLFNVGDGADTIADAPSGQGDPESSVIAFGEGILSWQVYFGLGSLVVHYGEGDSIRFTAFDADDPYSTPVFERLEFADGAVMLYEDMLANGFYLNGTEGDDVITGTAVQDSINGLGGNDTLSGGAGHDALYGGEGDDLLFGGEDNDDLYGGQGRRHARRAARGTSTRSRAATAQTPTCTPSAMAGTKSTSGTRRLARWTAFRLQGFDVADRARYAQSVELLPGDGRRRPSDPRQHAGGSRRGDRAHRVRGRHGLDAGGSRGRARRTARRHGRRGRALGHSGRRHDQRDLAPTTSSTATAGTMFSPEARASDFYYFAAGDGHDTVDNFDTDGSYDAFHFVGRRLERHGALQERKRPCVHAGADSVALAGWYSRSNRRIDSVYFEADGTYWDAAMIEALAPVGGNSAPQLASPLGDLVLRGGCHVLVPRRLRHVHRSGCGRCARALRESLRRQPACRLALL